MIHGIFQISSISCQYKWPNLRILFGFKKGIGSIGINAAELYGLLSTDELIDEIEFGQYMQTVRFFAKKITKKYTNKVLIGMYTST